MPRIVRSDPFNAVLLSSESLVVSEEQRAYIKEILNISSSDNQFAAKAYNAIVHVLTAEPTVPPVVSSLTPSSAVIGEPAFDLHVHGTGFTAESVIVFNGYDEPTTFVSATELTTGVNMPLWEAPVVVPVYVKNGDVLSDPVDFSFTSVTSLSGVKKPVEQHKFVEKK